MKPLIVFLVICLLLFLPGRGACQFWTGSINLSIGVKELNDDDWAPWDTQLGFGILMDFREEHWPVGIAFDVMRSSDDASEFDPILGNIDVEVNTLEIGLGVRKILAKKRTTIKPYIGAGIAYVNADSEVTGYDFVVSDDDSALGFWADAGFHWMLNPEFSIGVDARWSTGEVTIFEEKNDAGGLLLGFMVGHHW